MAAGLGFKTFTSGEVLTAADTNGYLMQGILVFASASARNAAITSPQEGQYCYLKDTNSTEYYDGAAWVSGVEGDISGVTAGTGITGGGTSGTVTVSFDQANFGGGQFSAGKNAIINGDFYWNQRAFTSTTSNATFTFDRFNTNATDGTTTFTAQTFTLGSEALTGADSPNYLQIATTGQTLSTALSSIAQKVEGVRTFAGQTVTMSFYAKASAGTPNITAFAAQNFGSGGSSIVFTGSTKKAITTSWARYSFTIAVPSISGKTVGTGDHIRFDVCVSAGTDRNAYTDSLGIQTGTFQVWGVQVEIGSTATPFQTATGTLQGELAACQRYFEQYDAASGQVFYSGYQQSSTSPRISLSVVPKRTTPTISFTGTLRVIVAGGTDINVTTIDAIAYAANSNMLGFRANIASGGTAGDACALYASGAVSVLYSAEL